MYSMSFYMYMQAQQKTHFCLTWNLHLQPLEQHFSVVYSTVLEIQLQTTHTHTHTNKHTHICIYSHASTEAHRQNQKIPVKVTHSPSSSLLRWTLCTWVSGLSPGCSIGEMDLPGKSCGKIWSLIPLWAETGFIYLLLPLLHGWPMDNNNTRYSDPVTQALIQK